MSDDEREQALRDAETAHGPYSPERWRIAELIRQAEQGAAHAVDDATDTEADGGGTVDPDGAAGSEQDVAPDEPVADAA